MKDIIYYLSTPNFEMVGEEIGKHLELVLWVGFHIFGCVMFIIIILGLLCCLYDWIVERLSNKKG